MFHLGSHPEARRLLRSRLYLIGLVLAFAGPLVASVVLYHNPQLRGDVGGDSHGSLILPPQPLGRDLFRLPDQPPRWTLLYYARAATCNLDCEATLFMMRQVHQSLGSKRSRAQILILLEHAELEAPYAEVLKRFRSDQVRVSPKSPDIDALDDQPGDTLFIVDPLGNLLMHYDGRSTSRGILRDLKRLLTASRIG
ncbi:MAG: hypothetical protein OXN23_00475 [Gammaproteobacteria bacterium]|nr:hypothetical protein [Gammaproteobacteria bacterium]MDE0302975.1 hypothetical protein [Gammaproteobacteria bacterium]